MTPERWQQVKEIFHSALERAPAERAAFLAEACAGHDSLRREVETLIFSHEKTDHFIDAPAFQAAAEMLMDGQEFEPGATVGRYELRAVLGAGGMGRVYLAEDTKLRRKIALKVLPAASRGTEEEARRRVLREARAAAALDHPNICAIYEVDEEGDRCYIAMQYVEGETLEARMARGRLPLAAALSVAAQIADALAEAHAHGIIHRDIKPANIMLSGRGQVKVLDFGLAKTASVALNEPGEAATKSLLTTPGMILGTVPYMSPEQLRGESVDARTDIFSFGIVLYEMLSGQRAFARDTAADTIGAILHQQPPAPSSVDSSIPKALEDVVGKCLVKDAGARYQTMRQVAHDLDSARSIELAGVGTAAARTGPAEVDTTSQRETAFTDDGTARPASNIEYHVSEVKHHKRNAMLAAAGVVILVAIFGYYFYFAGGGEAIDSVAVLPFVNVSNDANTEYLSEGLSDSLINSLSQLPTLKKVIALSSVLRYKGKQIDPQAVGRELNVRAVLVGRLTQRGDELLISTELVDVRDNKRLWGGQYNRRLADVLTLQVEIAQEIADRLRLKLTGAEKQRLAKRETDNPEAYQLYLKGRFLRRNRVNHQEAISYLEQAIKLDPNFAAAYAQIAYAYYSMVFAGASSPQEAGSKFEAAVRRGLEIDDTLGDLHASLALLRANVQDWPGATREYQRAVELDPNSADVHAYYARTAWALRRFDDAILQMRRAQELDPLSPVLCADLGKILYTAGQREQAFEQYRKALELNPNYAGAHHHLSNYYLGEGKYEEAIAEAIKMASSAGADSLRAVQLGYVYAMAGRRAEAQKILHELEEQSKRRYGSPIQFAMIYTGLGDKERAFEYLQKQYEEYPGSLDFLQVSPEWDSLRSDPRYADLLRKMKFVP